MDATAISRASLSERTILAGREVFLGRRRGPLAILPFAGPAVIASIAYMDPGNFATNIQAGAGYGYELLWVALSANLVAMLFQALSAKIGIATGRNLAELCREHFAPPVVYALWAASEIAAMATELAELLGASLGLTLLCGVPLLASMLLVGIATYAALRLQGVGSITLAVGIVGATVMPHAIYLHSGLTQARLPFTDTRERRTALVMSNREVLLALGVAGLVNMAMIAMAAVAFHDGTHDQIAEIETAYRTLAPLLGAGAAGLFMLALLASGFSSSVVGVMAGQMIMQGFVSFRIPLWLRRLVVMAPSLAVVAAGMDITKALVLSQVVLSLVLPIPMVALVRFTASRDVMGASENPRQTKPLAAAEMVFFSFFKPTLLPTTGALRIRFAGG